MDIGVEKGTEILLAFLGIDALPGPLDGRTHGTFHAGGIGAEFPGNIPVKGFRGPVSGLTDIAVPSKLLLDVVKSLDDMPLTFNVDDNTYGIVITSGDGKYHLAGKNAETFPSMPEATETSLITMTSTSLIYAIGKTAFAASTDEVRPQMTGIFCDLKNDCATFVATDAHKLVRYRNKTVHTDNEVSFILPRKPVTMLRNILSICRDDAEVNIEYNKTNVYFTFENFYD